MMSVKRIAFYLLFLLYPFHLTISLFGSGFNISYGDVIVPIVLLLWSVGRFKSRELPSQFVYLVLFLAFCLSIVLLKILFGVPHLDMNLFLSQFLKILGAASWMVVSFIFISEYGTELLQEIIKVILVISFPVMLLSMFYVVTGSASRTSGTFNNPNIYANYVLFAISLCLCRIYYLKKNDTYNTKIKYYFILLPMLFTSVFLTGSRGGIIASLFFILFILFYLYSDDVHIPIKSVLIILLFVPLVLYYIFAETVAFSRVTDTIQGGGRNIEGRVQMWYYAIDAFASSPLFGVGLGQYTPYTPSTLNPHNIYLRYLSETGIIGFSLLSLLIINVFRSGLNNILNEGNVQNIILLSFIMSTLVQGLVTDVLYFRSLWITIGIVTALSHYDNELPR